MSCRSSADAVALSRDFALRLLSSMGLVSALTGCGGLVVFVEDDGETIGGSGAGGSGAGGFPNPVGGSGQGVGGYSTFVCEPTLRFDQEAVYQCIPLDGACDEAGSIGVHSQLSDVLSWESCDDFCCDSESVDGVPCGPDPTVLDQCCYVAIVGHYSECMGRPFTVHGEVVTAEVVRRDDWSTGSASEVAPLDAATSGALALAFAKNGAFEHASVASFARFSLDLLSLGAPALLLRDAQRAMADEIRHAEICFGLAARFGGVAVGPGPLACGQATPRSCEQMLVETVIEGCIGETIAALLAARAADLATDGGVKAALAEIAADEARHAELSWRTIAWALAAGRPSWRTAIERALHEAEIAVPQVVEPAAIDAAVWEAHGQLTQAETTAVVQAARTNVVMTCTKALLAASRPTAPVAGVARRERL